MPQRIEEEAMKDLFSPEGLPELMKKLAAFQSVTGTPGENGIARYIYDFFNESEYFKKNAEDLALIPAEKDGLRRSAVLAFVPALCATARTVILNGHFDVVDTDVCGDMAQAAFDPDLYTAQIGSRLPEGSEARQDWESGNWLFGRGVMDMKFGLAMYMAYVRRMAGRRGGLKVNLLFLAVPDEEGDSAGMRGALPFLCRFAERRGLELIAALSGEPAFWRKNGACRKSVREWFTGTTGKIMPVFFCVGREAHAGYAYEGVSSAVMASEVVLRMEGNNDFSDMAGSEVLPPPVCLKLRDLRENYSVTLPERSAAYFNVLTVSKTPRDIMELCKKTARDAIGATLERIRASAMELSAKAGGDAVRLPEWRPEVLGMDELKQRAAAQAAREGKAGGACSVEEWEAAFFSSLPETMDMREKGIACLDALASLAALKGPAIVVGFLPPYYPHRINRRRTENERRLRAIMETLRDEAASCAGDISLLECFSGIMDLSFMGFQGEAADLEYLSANMAGWGHVFSFPLHDLASLDVPIASVGPSGKDAHQATERLELDYSLNIAPALLEKAIAMLGE